jgi:tRNA (Thr-GGU) A37 N-methylase
MLDGTPLLDIKPYVPDFDVHPATKVGWYDRRAYPYGSSDVRAERGKWYGMPYHLPLSAVP